MDNLFKSDLFKFYKWKKCSDNISLAHYLPGRNSSLWTPLKKLVKLNQGITVCPVLTVISYDTMPPLSHWFMVDGICGFYSGY